VIPPKDKALEKHPQDSKVKHLTQDNIIPFYHQALTPTEKERLREIAYMAECIATIIDQLEKTKSRCIGERAAYILLRKNSKTISRLAGGNK